jgi:hypothetical protein
MNKPVWSLIGFFLFSMGLLSVILSLVGLNFTFLRAVSNLGVWSVIIQLTLLFGGVVILYVARTSADTE